jgi:hypothetical protein
MGYLVVKAPEALEVLQSGRRLGSTNEPIQVPCAAVFITLARPNNGTSVMVTRGRNATVACQSTTTLEFQAAEIGQAAPPGASPAPAGGGGRRPPPTSGDDVYEPTAP